MFQRFMAFSYNYNVDSIMVQLFILAKLIFVFTKIRASKIQIGSRFLGKIAFHKETNEKISKRKKPISTEQEKFPAVFRRNFNSYLSMIFHRITYATPKIKCLIHSL